MTTVQIESELLVPASPAAVYRVLADYADARRRLESRSLVAGSRVLAGGLGGGTRLELELRDVPGSCPLGVVVTEPEAGEVLVETLAAIGVRRTFVLEPCRRGLNTRVSAVLELPATLAGTPLDRALRALHSQELERLARVVDDCALADSLWPHVSDEARAAALLPETTLA